MNEKAALIILIVLFSLAMIASCNSVLKSAIDQKLIHPVLNQVVEPKKEQKWCGDINGPLMCPDETH